MFENQIEVEQAIKTLIGFGCNTMRIHVNYYQYAYANKYFAYAYFNEYEVVSSTIAIFHVKIKNNVK